MASAGRAIGLVALHEVRRVAGAFQRPSTLVGMVAAALLLAALWPIILERGIQPDRGLYPVTVHAGSPFEDAVAADHRFEVVDGGLAAGAVLELPAGGEPKYQDTAAGRAA